MVEVPMENLLGSEDEGFRVFLDTLDGGRIGIAAHALGIAQGAFELALRYTNERGSPTRTQGSRPTRCSRVVRH